MSTADVQNKKNLVLKLAVVILPLLFFSYIFGMALNFSLNDPDLWWHLKTGEYIVNNWEVPDVDPFAYTTPRPLTEKQKIGLRAQWLGQVLFYLSYKAGGLAGVGVMRSLLILMPMLTLYIWLTRKGLKPWTSLIIVSFPAFLLVLHLFYSFERPQGISFLLALIVIMLLERAKGHCTTQTSRRVDISFWLLPLVMAVWSNIHAGFIVGNVIIMIYATIELLKTGIKRLRGSTADSIRSVFFIICLVSIIASFLNPNTYKLFYSYLFGLASSFLKSIYESTRPGASGWVRNVVLEYKPLIYFYKNLGYRWLAFYWVFTGILYLVLFIKYWFKRKVDVTELFVVSFITFFANYYARGLMFSMTILPFYMGKSISEIKLPEIKYRVFFKSAVATMLALSISYCTYTYRQMPYFFKPGVAPRWITPWYPVELVEVLKTLKLKGPMYNFYTWGGYLIWSLYPEYQVFIDGRAIDDMINRTADAILKTYPGWEANLDAYNINFIVIPVVFRESGHKIPLATALVDNDRWKLIYIGYNSAIFVRNVPQNSHIIRKYNIDKKAVYKEIIRVENVLLRSMPWNPVFNITKADALLALGRYEEAKAIYERFPREGIHGLKMLKKLGY
jgi:hypothetical protein